MKIVADRTVAAMSDFVCGANEADFHFTGVNWGRDLPEPDLVADIRNVVEGDPSPDGKGTLAIQRGIEVGHVFLLGTNYSRSDEGHLPRREAASRSCCRWAATASASRASSARRSSRTTTSAASSGRRRSRRSRSSICPIGYDRSPAVQAAADALHDELLAAGIDAILDDRGERPGAMFADWELIGVPHRVVLSDRGLKDGEVEYQGRRDAAADGRAARRGAGAS